MRVKRIGRIDEICIVCIRFYIRRRSLTINAISINKLMVARLFDHSGLFISAAAASYFQAVIDAGGGFKNAQLVKDMHVEASNITCGQGHDHNQY